MLSRKVKYSPTLRKHVRKYNLDDKMHSIMNLLGKDAQDAMPTFVDDFICDPKLPYHGFTSWDDFFTRQFTEFFIKIISN